MGRTAIKVLSLVWESSEEPCRPFWSYLQQLSCDILQVVSSNHLSVLCGLCYIKIATGFCDVAAKETKLHKNIMLIAVIGWLIKALLVYIVLRPKLLLKIISIFEFN